MHYLPHSHSPIRSHPDSHKGLHRCRVASTTIHTCFRLHPNDRTNGLSTGIRHHCHQDLHNRENHLCNGLTTRMRQKHRCSHCHGLSSRSYTCSLCAIHSQLYLRTLLVPCCTSRQHNQNSFHTFPLHPVQTATRKLDWQCNLLLCGSRHILALDPGRRQRIVSPPNCNILGHCRSQSMHRQC